MEKLALLVGAIGFLVWIAVVGLVITGLVFLVQYLATLA